MARLIAFTEATQNRCCLDLIFTFGLLDIVGIEHWVPPCSGGGWDSLGGSLMSQPLREALPSFL
jgi:hypothetical protein